MWQIAGASIAGSDHTMPGKPGYKNNQDAHYIYSSDRMTIGIVADGCGSGISSEVGSKIGVRLLGEIIRDMLDRGSMLDWDRIRMTLLAQISVLASAMGRSLSTTVGDYFLFSLVGYIITQTETHICHCGDGIYVVDGVVTQLGPYPNNAPPYLSYGLLGDASSILHTISLPTDSITSIAVGTDGTDCIRELESTLAHWTSTDAVFSNPDVLRRRLAMMNLEKIQNGILIPGPLKDDITLVIARKSNPNKEI
jgi:hypothetical protein